MTLFEYIRMIGFGSHLVGVIYSWEVCLSVVDSAFRPTILLQH